MRLTILIILAGLLAGAARPGALHAPAAPPCTEPEARAFDFLIGEWKMHLRSKNQRGEWGTPPVSRSVVVPMLDGCALLDEWIHYNRAGEVTEKGFTVRTYDPNAKQWRLFWTDNGVFQGRMQMWEGTFEDGVGTFIGGDAAPHPRGRTTSKIVFSDIGQDALHWEMFFTRDDGETWDLVAVREYERVR